MTAGGIFRKTRIFFVFQSQICFKILKQLLVYQSSYSTMGPRSEFRTQNHDPALFWQSIFLNSSWTNLCRSGFKLSLFFQTRFVSKPWRKFLVLDYITVDFFPFRNQIFSSFYVLKLEKFEPGLNFACLHVQNQILWFTHLNLVQMIHQKIYRLNWIVLDNHCQTYS